MIILINLIVEMEPQEVQGGNEVKICEFYLARKRRFCKFNVMKGSKYCAAHCSDLQGKVECPYEKGMFIDASKLQKHLEICPRIREKKKQQDVECFNKGINLQQNNKPKQETNINHLLEIPTEKLLNVIKKVVNLYNKWFGEKSKQFIMSTPEQKIQNLTNDHIQAHLLAEQAFKAKLIRNDAIYLEFGAGKGILSYAIANKVKDIFGTKSKNVLLQREARRNKFDRFMKDNLLFQRYKIDVSDFDMHTLPTIMAKTAHQKNDKIIIEELEAELNQMQLIGICKHMCGGALDISVRSLLRSTMNGCVFASCCHHLCSYQTYLNNKFFEEQGMEEGDLRVMFKISSWGTKSSWIKEQQINLEELANIEYNKLNGNTKIMIGRIAKRMIDLGRAKILKGQLIRYCSDQITPQNFVILSSQNSQQ